MTLMEACTVWAAAGVSVGERPPSDASRAPLQGRQDTQGLGAAALHRHIFACITAVVRVRSHAFLFMLVTLFGPGCVAENSRLLQLASAAA